MFIIAITIHCIITDQKLNEAGASSDSPLRRAPMEEAGGTKVYILVYYIYTNMYVCINIYIYMNVCKCVCIYANLK
jgi:hypothetical protein